MKRYVYWGITPILIITLLYSLVWTVFAVDGTLPLQGVLEGNYCVTHGGAGIFDGVRKRFTVEIEGTPVEAYMYWSGRYIGANNGDSRIRAEFNGNGITTVSAAVSESEYAGYRRGGIDVYYYTYRSGNIVSMLTGLGSTVEVAVNNLNTPEAHGIGIVVISEGPTCPYSQVQLNFGLDGFYWNFVPDAGPDTQVTCADFAPAAVIRTMNMQMFVGGVEHEAMRADRIWYATGSGAKPTDIVSAGDPANVLAGPVPPLNEPPYPLNGGEGDWDDYTNTITIQPGDTFACFQIESIDGRVPANGTSGVWLELMTHLIHAPGIEVLKLTNGNDAKNANDADVPQIPAGATVTWTYLVTNTGSIPFDVSAVTVTDSVEGAVTDRIADTVGNNDNSFEPGEVWTYQKTGVARTLSSESGSFIVQGCGNVTTGSVVRNTYANGVAVQIGELLAADTSHYCNPLLPGLEVLKLTNGNDAKNANDADVPQIPAGVPVTWTYLVTNTGQVAFDASEVTVTDSVEGAVTDRIADTIGNNDNSFEPGEVWTYQKTGVTRTLSNESGTFIVQGCGNVATGEIVRNTYANGVTATVGELSATDTSHYCNPLVPGIEVLKLTNGNDAKNANDADVPVIPPAATVTWTYLVTNTGSLPFDVSEVTVTDSVEGAVTNRIADTIGNNDSSFEPGEVWTYQKTGVARTLSAESGSFIEQGCGNVTTGGVLRNTYANGVTATAGELSATDTSHYCNPLVPGIEVLKLTNGNDAKNANDADVPQVPAGATVTWTYLVTNTGAVSFDVSEVTVTDSVEGVVTDRIADTIGNNDTSFEPGEVWTYQKTGVARTLSTESGSFIVQGCGNVTTGGLLRNTYANGVIATAGELSAGDTSHYCNTLDTASVGNRVWGDIDPDGATPNAIAQGDGLQDNDPRELGIDGIIVELYTADGTLVATTTTSNGGEYLFADLAPGDYYLVFINPLGEGIWTQPNVGSNDEIDSDATTSVDDGRGPAQRTEVFTLEPGEVDLSWDAGLIGLSGAGSAAVGNFVWNDRNQDGIQSGGDETGVAGVVVRLFTSDGTQVAETTTDDQGIYNFPAVDPGEYYIEFVLPDNFAVSPQNAGGDDEVDSDVDANTQRTATFTLPVFTTDLRWDLGIFQPTSLGEGDEPVRTFIFIPVVSR